MAAANKDLLAGQHEADPLMEHGQQMWREHAARIHVFHEWGQDPSGAPISPKGINPQALCFECAWNYGLLELFGIPSGYEGKGAEASSLLLASYLSGTTGLTNSSLKAVRVLDGANKWGRRTFTGINISLGNRGPQRSYFLRYSVWDVLDAVRLEGLLTGPESDRVIL